jgi:hypothetical protein
MGTYQIRNPFYILDLKANWDFGEGHLQVI